MENPYTQPHYLTMFFPVEPKVIVMDRHAEGDYFKKPTQFFFINCKPEQNVVMQPIQHVDMLRVSKGAMDMAAQSIKVKRSLMHPQFADRFIKTYVLDKEGGVWN